MQKMETQNTHFNRQVHELRTAMENHQSESAHALTAGFQLMQNEMQKMLAKVQKPVALLHPLLVANQPPGPPGLPHPSDMRDSPTYAPTSPAPIEGDIDLVDPETHGIHVSTQSNLERHLHDRADLDQPCFAENWVEAAPGSGLPLNLHRDCATEEDRAQERTPSVSDDEMATPAPHGRRSPEYTPGSTKEVLKESSKPRRRRK